MVGTPVAVMLDMVAVEVDLKFEFEFDRCVYSTIDSLIDWIFDILVELNVFLFRA